MERIHCPKHEESTPSCVIYEDHAFCFGGCGRMELSEIGVVGLTARRAAILPSDLISDLSRIAALPIVKYRGLDLPIDGDSVYIVWPDKNYYKRRKILPGGGPKYICPRGHSKPLYISTSASKSGLCMLVEGELNALSISGRNPSFAVCSPGGCGDFTEETLVKTPSFFRQYTHFTVLLDKDRAGLEAAKRIRTALLRCTPYVKVILLDIDANQLLQDGTLEQEMRKWT